MPLKSLPSAPRTHAPQVRPAYRLLEGAHKSVKGLFDVATRLAEARRSANRENRGRLAQEEEDVLRAALVLTSSGLDASMKRLVNDVGRALIPRAGTSARLQYEQYLNSELTASPVSTGVHESVISTNPTEKLLSHYLAERTKASFQGSRDLKTRVRNTLGIPNLAVPDARVDALDDFFVARNRIVHDMDYQVASGDSMARNRRSSDATASTCADVFSLAVDFMRAAALLLK